MNIISYGVKMIRVTDSIVCPICKRGSDGCLVAEDGQAAICVRTVSDKRCGAAGFYHQTNGPPITKKQCKRKYVAPLNWVKIMELYRSKGYSDEYGVIGGAYFDETHYIPMYNENVEVCGIQRVFKDRSKAMMSGSQAGIFLRPELWPSEHVCITEGASDTVTAIQKLGYHALGKANCSNGDDIVIKLLQSRNPVIIADNDQVGLAGARTLSIKLLDVGIRSVIIVPPYEGFDLTDWYKHSGKLPVRSYITGQIRKVLYDT